MEWLGLDIGGANIKVANGKGYAASYHFPMWKNHKQLAQDLRTYIAEAPPADHLAVTMTGELADCFENAKQGVEYILYAVATAADRRHTRVYLRNGQMVTPQVAVQRTTQVAAANWHALAAFAGRFAKKELALLIDIGSTTCDVVPLMYGQPINQGESDTQRMLRGELVYTGVERSPLCAVVSQVPYRGQACPMAQELFATSRDAYLVLGDLPEDSHSRATADGRPATRAAALGRLAKSICADGDEFNETDARAIAEAVAEAQVEKIAAAVRQVTAKMPAPPSSVILVGQGEFLAGRVLKAIGFAGRIVSLAREAGAAVSRCGPAHALAVLAREAAGG